MHSNEDDHTDKNWLIFQRVESDSGGFADNLKMIRLNNVFIALRYIIEEKKGKINNEYYN